MIQYNKSDYMIKYRLRSCCITIVCVLVWYLFYYINKLPSYTTTLLCKTSQTTTSTSTITTTSINSNDQLTNNNLYDNNANDDYTAFMINQVKYTRNHRNDNHQSSSFDFCDIISSHVPFQLVWEQQIKHHIMNVSLLQSDWSYNIRTNINFTNWVYETMQYFTYSKLQHTILSLPIDQQRMIQRIHTIIENKLKHSHSSSSSSSSSPPLPSPPPLRILVFGGSVTTGHECLENKFHFLLRKDGKDNGRKSSTDEEVKVCAWPGRLQDMVNALFGENIIEITNMATGGAQTEMSTTVLEFGLLPGHHTPDIIIWDHGINDATVPINTQDGIETNPIHAVTDNIFNKLQAFYQATLNLPKLDCNQTDPPIVILLDTLLGHEDKLPHMTQSLTASTAVSKMLSWYPNIWGISYANVVRPYVLSHLFSRHEPLPLLGSDGLFTHPGMMYHISLAWTILFNVAYALHSNCVSRTIKRMDVPRPGQSTSSIESNLEYFDTLHIPELSDDLLILDIPSQWKERVPETITESMCIEQQKVINDAASKFTNHSSLRCYYVWVANRILHIESPREIINVMKPYMIHNDGWSSFHADSKTSPGWVVKNGQGSYFELMFNNVPVSIESLTIIYMQSYSKKWYNSTLQIDCAYDIVQTTTESYSKNHELPATSTETATTKRSTIQHIISGYHKEETSILVPLKLPLPKLKKQLVPSDAKFSLRLHLKFQLIYGETFKIAGIALC